MAVGTCLKAHPKWIEEVETKYEKYLKAGMCCPVGKFDKEQNCISLLKKEKKVLLYRLVQSAPGCTIRYSVASGTGQAYYM